jgi:hypothetical protein
MARARTWKCRRHTAGVKCGAVNPSRKRLCQICGKPKPARRKPAHMAALEQPYEAYLAMNHGIERCAICDRPPGSRRLDRDHDHITGRPRGLLCARCNRALPSWMTPKWLRKATYYLEREA